MKAMQPDGKLRVALIDQSAEMGGVEMTTLAQAVSMDKDRFTPVLICPGEGELARRCRRAGIEVRIVPRPSDLSVSLRIGGRLVPNPAAILWAVALILVTALRLRPVIRQCADVVVTKGLFAHFYGGIAARAAGMPCAWCMQEMVNGGACGRIYKWILSRAAAVLADVIVVDAASVGTQFEEKLHERGAIRVVYNGVDSQVFRPDGPARPAAPVPPGARVIGQVGRLIPEKGQHVLIEAFAAVSRDWPDAHLVFAGSTLFGAEEHLDRLRALAALHGVEHRVHFAGFCEDVAGFLRSLDLFVHPSIEADSPVSVLEAMAAGVPVIATDVPGTAELVRAGHDALLVPPSDAGALAAAIRRLLGDDHERRRLAQAARLTAERLYSAEASSARFESILAGLATVCGQG